MNVRKLIVFDMDGVLVDVSSSYRDVVRETTYLFFGGAMGFERLPHPLFSLEDLAVVKRSGGLNNDWELTYLVISLLLEKTEVENSLYKRIVKRESEGEKIDRFISPADLLKEYLRFVDVSPLAEYLNRKDMPLSTIYRERGRIFHPIVKFFSRGDVEDSNVIKRIFQEVYLGKELFNKIYASDSLFYSGEGFIDRELLIIDKGTLDWLSKHHVLAVATGRPRVEAEYALDRFGIREYFSRILTLDDCLEEEKRILNEEGKRVSLTKPHPYMLDKIGKEFEKNCSGYYLIGDMPDDMICASYSSYDYVAIGFVVSRDKASPGGVVGEDVERNLRRHGAKEVFFSVEELKKFF